MTPRNAPRSIPNLKHGLSTLKRAMRELGGRAIDGRTTIAKALGQWKAELINDLGGRDAISTQQAAIIDLALKTKLLLDSIDAWLVVQPSLVDRRRRAVLPVVRERQQLADALARYLVQLGLERRARRAPSLNEYVSQTYGADSSAPSHEQAGLTVSTATGRSAEDQTASRSPASQDEVQR